MFPFSSSSTWGKNECSRIWSGDREKGTAGREGRGEKDDETNTFLHVMSLSVSNDHLLLHLLVLYESSSSCVFHKRWLLWSPSEGKKRKGVTSPSHVTTLANGLSSCNEKRKRSVSVSFSVVACCTFISLTPEYKWSHFLSYSLREDVVC